MNLAKKYISYFKKENIDIKSNKTKKHNKYKKKEQDNVGVHGFIVFFQNCNHIKA
jgi:hypothetical protein